MTQAPIHWYDATLIEMHGKNNSTLHIKISFVRAATSSPSSDLVHELPNFLIKSNEKILFDNFFLKLRIYIIFYV